MGSKVAVVVTGGVGFIGAHTCKALYMVGYTKVACDNLLYGHRSAVKWGPLEEGDIADGARLASVFDRFKPVAISHARRPTEGRVIHRSWLGHRSNQRRIRMGT